MLNKRFPFLINSLVILFDLFIVNSIIYIFSKDIFSGGFFIYITFSWVLIAYHSKFYKVYRYTHISKLFSLLVSHLFIFILMFFTYFTVFKERILIANQFNSIFFIVIFSVVFKLVSFFLLKKYRLSGKNFRNVIVIGESKIAKNIANIFDRRNDLGYSFHGFFFDKKSKSNKYLGVIDKSFSYTKEYSIDEIYCEINSLDREKIKEIRNFCKENNIGFCLIPESQDIYSKEFVLEHYGAIPILKVKPLPFEKSETHFIKRTFDIVFSLFICISILSWALPILWVLVKCSSKGPFFFQQQRDGMRDAKFSCLKIRSMQVNNQSDKVSTTKNDDRVTKIGAFIRKTSLDELPQFFNVLKGDMSIIGPRPHMSIQTKKYIKEVDNYIFRNSIKPGITGLAQVSGFRGEVQKKSDIENRVRLDIFYIENWSFFLDIKIIFQTVFNVFKGQNKAY